MDVRNKKLFLFLFVVTFAFASAFLLNGNTGQAAGESDSEFLTELHVEPQDNTIPINENFHVELPEGNYSAEQTSEGAKDIVRIIDNETGELYKEITIEEELQLNNFGALNESFFVATSSTTHNGLTVTLNCRLLLYQSGSFVQIENVDDVWWTTGGGAHTLQASNTAYTPTSFPTQRVEATGQTTMQIEIDVDLSAEFEAAGFTIGAGAGSSVFARKTVNDSLVYSTER
ncbi:hypothetical protein [Alkalicoccobacillus gibsonii]|uniref:hypothetical protein n=1 Tax=Alkalicoccobacillus gibsonii TaxID=79881 RepID=UPI0019318DBE|nr:hypothetical protein [Alkalicoccobacillus gibsonii]MBM0067936.1 hypothetical protein [Alkalicoccobacillus gibsonii]